MRDYLDWLGRIGPHNLCAALRIGLARNASSVTSLYGVWDAREWFACFVVAQDEVLLESRGFFGLAVLDNSVTLEGSSLRRRLISILVAITRMVVVARI